MSALFSTDLLDRVRERLATADGDPTPATVAAAIRSESGGVLGDTDLLAALRVLQTELTGAGPLEALLAQPGVTDVLVTAPDAVWVDRGAGLERVDVTFADEAAVRRLAQRLALSAGRRLDDAQPWVDGRLPAAGGGDLGVRLHAVLAPVAQAGTCLSLRVLRQATQGFDDLAASGALPGDARSLLERIVRARLAFLVTGGTGAGKTTMLAALLGRVDPGERIVCVEDAAELAPGPPARGASGRASGQRRGRRCGDGARPRPPVPAYASGPHRGRRGAGRRGGRSADGAQHRSRRRCGHRACQLAPRAPGAARGARRTRRARPGCTAQPIGGRGPGGAARRAGHLGAPAPRGDRGAAPRPRRDGGGGTGLDIRWGVHAAGKVLQDMLLRRGES